MGLIIDTCIFIKAERSPEKLDFNRFTMYDEAYISAITVTELLVGVHSADTKARRLKRTAFVEAILAKMPVFDFTAEVARVHAELYSQLAKKGQLIGAHDLIIAATALAHDCALLTDNKDEFNRVPGLKVLS